MTTDKLIFAVLGAGNGGFCTAADLTLRGYEVRLYESPAFATNIEAVLQAGGIALRGVAGEGFAKPALVSTDIKATLNGADIILIITTAEGHKPLARACAPHLHEGHMIILIPGCVCGALEFRQELLKQGGSKDVIVAESTSLMYAVKKENGNGVWARGYKNHLPLAALPTHHTQTVIDKLTPVFPQFTPVGSVLETSFNNLNHVVHPPGVLMNLGFTENASQGEWFFYPDGYTPGTGRIGDKLDEERMAIANAYDIPATSILEELDKYYGHQGISGNNLHEMFRDSPIHGHAKGPQTTDTRLLTEDVPFGLVPLASFGKVAGVPTPTMDAIITLSGIVNQTDYRKTGRTLASLGLEGYSVEEILDFVGNGSRDRQ